MRSRIPFAGLAVVAIAMAVASPVQASFFTEQATVNVHSNQTPIAPITQATLIDGSAGRTFTNTYGIDPTTGDALVRSVGVLLIPDIKQFNTSVQTGIAGPGSSPSEIVVAFALDGHTLAPPGSGLPGALTVQFTSGGAGFWQAASNFATDDASKWFANFNNPLWASAVAAPTNIFVGNGDTLGGVSPGNLAFPASTVNMSAINSVSPNLIQATLLFNETSDPNHFLDTTTNFQGGSTAGLVDSVLAIANLTIGAQGAASDLLNKDTPGVGGGTAAQKQAVVNSLAGFFGLSNLGGANSGFANFGSGGITDYTPTATSGDFSATALSALYSGLNSPVPEPSTFGLMAIGTAVIGLFTRGRQNRKA